MTSSSNKENLAEQMYKITLRKREKCRKEKKVRDEIQCNRQLISQLTKNIRENKWNAQLGYVQIQNIIKENAKLVDSEDGANNYEDFCIHPDAQYKNKAAQWTSSITPDHPMFKELYKKKRNIPVQKDMVLKSILQSKSGSHPKPPPSFASLTTSTSTRQPKGDAGNTKKSSNSAGIKKTEPVSKWTTSFSSQKEVINVPSDQESPEFDLCAEDIIIEDDEDFSDKKNGFAAVDNSTKPLFNKQWPNQNDFTANSSRSAKPSTTNSNTGRGAGFCANPPTTSSFLSKIRGAAGQNISDPSVGRGGAQNKTSTTWNQQSGFNNKSTNQKPNSTGGSNPNHLNTFKTAHEQLFIDQQNRNKRGGGGGAPARVGGGGLSRNYQGGGGGGSNEINFASYGGVKKCLGTRPGPASGFKPPVKQEEQQPEQINMNRVMAAAANPNSFQQQGNNEENPELLDPRYKNIDQKMIELIMNEIMDNGAPVNWNDIAGLQFQKKCVKEIVVLPMLRPDIFTGLRGPPKGLLLFGPPGTGKTLIGKCIASQSKSTFFSISASSLTSKWVGEGEKMVRALFAVAKVHQPSVIFIDEIDSLLSARSESEHESSRRMKTEFLVQLDGAGTDGAERILIVGATNRPQELDEAARRRLVKRLLIPLPEAEARLQIIQNLLGKEKNDLSEEDVSEIVSKSDGYSGADMANLCREAAMGPIRSMDLSLIENMDVEQVRPINKQDLLDALRQVKASVSDQDLQMYEDWNEKYGAGK